MNDYAYWGWIGSLVCLEDVVLVYLQARSLEGENVLTMILM